MCETGANWNECIEISIIAIKDSYYFIRNIRQYEDIRIYRTVFVGVSNPHQNQGMFLTQNIFV